MRAKKGSLISFFVRWAPHQADDMAMYGLFGEVWRSVRRESTMKHNGWERECPSEELNEYIHH